MIINERQGLNKPNKIYLLEPAYSKELMNSKSNDTKINNTEYIKIENNDSYDISNNNFTNFHSNHTNNQQNEFNNDALKFQIREIRIIKSVLLKGKNLLIPHMIHITV